MINLLKLSIDWMKGKFGPQNCAHEKKKKRNSSNVMLTRLNSFLMSAFLQLLNEHPDMVHQISNRKEIYSDLMAISLIPCLDFLDKPIYQTWTTI